MPAFFPDSLHYLPNRVDNCPPHGRGPETAVPNILNNDKVFIVYQYITMVFPTV